MDPMMNDPLMLFLKQADEKKVKETAKEQPPLSSLLEDGNALKDNLDDMPRGKEVQELTSASPRPLPGMVPTTPCSSVKELFENSGTMRKKLYEKDHEFEGFDQGVVDRILGL